MAFHCVKYYALFLPQLETIIILSQADKPRDINAKRKENIMPRKSTKTKSPVEQEAIAGSGKVKLIFECNVSDLKLTGEGDYFGLPYLVEGTMQHGKVEVPAFISKGRVIVPTAQGRKKRGTAAAPKKSSIDISKLI